ncbi:LysR family transcriptional regulator [Ramlibacter sp.]|uniref:LysR family transcriptional regulator n=1 Tax=Ramlibacter sp. TaxID=1917967 RepID=UPI002D7223D4|nr:LysR substrate-binding domain-containing protein [Ramlibacter sp.]HYD75968.1 LysR substrate-binding domain-containing protein [Ramlibacter sp.]
MDIKLSQLRALLHVVDHGGIRAAARELDWSQAAVTRAIRELEAATGRVLVQRGPAGTALTEDGQRVTRRARLIENELQEAMAELQQSAREQKQVLASVTPLVIAGGLGQACRWFRQRYPQVELGLFEGVVSHGLPALREGAVDLAIEADHDDLGEEFACRELVTTHYVVVVRRGHPVLAQPSLAALRRFEWVFTVAPSSARVRRFLGFFEAAGLAPPERQLQCEAYIALQMLRQGDAVTVLPQPLLAAPELADLVAVPLAGLPRPPLRLTLLTRRDRPLVPAAEYFVECVGYALTGRSLAA